MKMNEVFSKDFLAGLKQGLKIAQDVARKQGYEIHFPDVDEMMVEQGKTNSEDKE